MASSSNPTQKDTPVAMLTIDKRFQPNPREQDTSSLQRPPQTGKPTFCEGFLSWKFWQIAIYGLLVGFSGQMPDIVAPVIGKQYFGDAGTYAYWYGVFNSLAGLLGFFCQGYVGQLSDIYGRKRLMLFTLSCSFISTWWLTFTRNIWVYLALMPVSFLNGAFGGVPTVLQASLADRMHPQYRTLAFGLLYGLAGLVVVSASIMTALLESTYGITAVMLAYDASMLAAFLWLVFVCEESLSLETRHNNRVKYETIAQQSACTLLEPLRPLYRMKDSKLLRWFGVIALFVGLPESGIDDLLASYCFQVLNIEDTDSETKFTSEATICIGGTMIVSQLLFLPFLVRFIKDDVVLIAIGLMAVVLFSVWGIVMYIFPSYAFGLGMWSAFGTSFLTIPILSGALSKRLDEKDQGVGLGIIHAMKGITWCVAPYLFSALFDVFEHDGFWVTMPYIVATIFIACAFPVLCMPLRNAIREYDISIDQAELEKGPLLRDPAHLQWKEPHQPIAVTDNVKS